MDCIGTIHCGSPEHQEKDKGNKATRHTTFGLARRRRHTFIVNCDDCRGFHRFVCPMDCKVPIWAFKDYTWEPLCGTSLAWPMLKLRFGIRFTDYSKKKCFSNALRHTLVVLGMH